MRAVRVDGFDSLVEIGRGGSATVYSAVQQPLGRAVAIKVLAVDLGDEAARRRFERECAVVGALGDAPGIVAVYATAFTDDGRPCIVMRLMRSSLADVLRRHGPLTPAQVREVGLVAAGALAHAHSRGVVHRDVKPANLLLSEFGEVALGDFDIASIGAVTASTSTQDSLSPPHAPPERLSGDADAGPAGDVWSLGSTLFTLLHGSPPFGSASSSGGMAGLVDRVRLAPLPPLTRADVPPELVAVLERALAKAPGDRWPDAASMAAALAAAPIDGSVEWPVDPPSPVPSRDSTASAVEDRTRAVGPVPAGWPALVAIASVVVAAVLVGVLIALG